MTRRTLTLALAALIIVACNGDDSADPTTSSVSSASISTAQPTTTTTTPPVTSTSILDTSSTEPPTTVASTESPTTSGPTADSSTTVESTTVATTQAPIAPDDWKAVLEELDRRVVSLYAAPDLDRIGEYCAFGSECAEGLETQLGDAIAKGQHIEGQHPFEVLEITQATVGEPSPVGEVAVVIFIVSPDSSPPAQLVDAAGNVIDTLSVTTTKSRARFTLASVEDPVLPWRVLLAENMGPVP